MVSVTFLLVAVACFAAVSGTPVKSKDQGPGTTFGDLCGDDLKLLKTRRVGSEWSQSGPRGYNTIRVDVDSEILGYQVIDLKQDGNAVHYQLTNGGIGKKEMVMKFSGQYYKDFEYLLLVWGKSDNSKDQGPGAIFGDLCGKDFKLLKTQGVGSEWSQSGPRGYNTIRVDVDSAIHAYQVIDLQQDGNDVHYKLTKGGIGKKEMVMQFSGQYYKDFEYLLLVWGN